MCGAHEFEVLPENTANVEDTRVTLMCKGGPDETVAWAVSSDRAVSWTNIALMTEIVHPTNNKHYEIDIKENGVDTIGVYNLVLKGLLNSDAFLYRCQLFGTSENAYAFVIAMGMYASGHLTIFVHKFIGV